MDKRRPSEYPSETLDEWKRNRETSLGIETDSSGVANEEDLDRLLIDGAMALFVNSTVSLGGTGGSSPGAGGGGGAAIGHGSIAGAGGPGGSTYNLNGSPGNAPGAGGGGGAAVGPFAVGGEGGGGGDTVVGDFALSEEVVGARILVGEGGAGGVHGPGQDGEDTVIQFVNLADEVVGEFRAKGGIGGMAGSPGRASAESVDLLLCNFAEVRDGLVYVLGGGWDNFRFIAVPNTLQGALVISVASFDVGLVSIQILFADPDGNPIAEAPVEFAFPDTLSGLKRLHQVVCFAIPVDRAGVWAAIAATGSEEVARYSVNVVIAP